jgi:hypothetical protein
LASGVLVPVYADLIVLAGTVLVLEVEVVERILVPDPVEAVEELLVPGSVEVVETLLVLDPVAEELPLLTGL